MSAPSRNKLQAAPFVSPAEAESRLRDENARLRAAVEDWHDEAAELRAALAELVRLKDGPRDEAYRRDKEAAWAAARRLAGGENEK